MRDKIKVAVWGVGRHARKRILAAVKDAKSVELMGLCTRNQVVGKEGADHMDCFYFSSSEEMLADPNIEAVFLCTPTGLHFSQGQAVLQAGKHLWCEKALTTSYAHSRQLIELAIDNKSFPNVSLPYNSVKRFVQVLHSD